MPTKTSSHKAQYVIVDPQKQRVEKKLKEVRLQRGSRRGEDRHTGRHQHDTDPECRGYRIFRNVKQDLRTQEDSSPVRIKKHFTVKHKPSHLVQEESDESPQEYAPLNRYCDKVSYRIHKGRHKSDHQKPKDQRKQIYLSETDLRDNHQRFYSQGDRVTNKKVFKESRPKLFRDNSFCIDKSQSEHNNFLDKVRSHLHYRDLDHIRYPEIYDRSKRFQHTNYRGEFGDGSFAENYFLNRRYFQDPQCLEQKNCTSICCNRPDNQNNYCLNTYPTTTNHTSKVDDPADRIVEKLKSDFIIAPKPDTSVHDKVLAKDGKGYFVYVPIPEEEESRKKRLDVLYKNLFSPEERGAEKEKRFKREINRIVEKYSYPERYKDSGRKEEQILIETFFKKCDQAGVKPRTSFKEEYISSKRSVSDIVEELWRYAPRESDSEFFAKFENRLRKAIRTDEENCSCVLHSSDNLDPYIKDLVGVLKRR